MFGASGPRYTSVFPFNLKIAFYWNEIFRYCSLLLLSYDYLLPFAVRPSICLSGRSAAQQQFTIISSYTTDIRITKPIYMISKNAISLNFSRNWSNLFIFFLFLFILFFLGGGSYTTYIKRVLSCDFQITIKNGNIDGGGRRMLFHIENFENCLLLHLLINFYTVDARITEPICMIPLCIQMLAIYLHFFSVFRFWNNLDFSDLTQNAISLWIISEIG